MRRIFYILLFVSIGLNAQLGRFSYQTTPSGESGWTIEDEFTYDTDNINGQGNWITVYNQVSVNASDEAYSDYGNDETCARYNSSLGDDQKAQVTLTSVGSAYFGPAVLCSGSGASADYYGYYANSSQTYAFKVVNGSWSQFGNTGNGASVDDVLEIQVDDGTITYLKNGSPDTEISVDGTASDGDITSGDSGVTGYNNQGDTTGDHFKADNI